MRLAAVFGGAVLASACGCASTQKIAALEQRMSELEVRLQTQERQIPWLIQWIHPHSPDAYAKALAAWEARGARGLPPIPYEVTVYYDPQHRLTSQHVRVELEAYEANPVEVLYSIRTQVRGRVGLDVRVHPDARLPPLTLARSDRSLAATLVSIAEATGLVVDGSRTAGFVVRMRDG